MELTELSLRDSGAIMELIRTAFAFAPWNDCWEDEATLRQYLQDIMGGPSSLALGLLDADRLVALALGRRKHWFHGVEYCIDDLCVSPACQGQGVGSALVAHIQAYARREGISLLSLKTSRRAAAYRFYQKNGFAEQEDTVFFQWRCPGGEAGE